MPDADSDLAARSARGDMLALEALYRRHVEKVWRYGRLRTNSRDAAAEIVQDTFLRVVRSIKKFEGRSAFATWLFTVTRSVAIEHARREQKDRGRGDGTAVLRLIPAPADPADSREGGQIRIAVRRAVARLPGAQRDAIVLCELSGFRVREAAETLGWGESRVKVTLFRARRRLRELLKEYVEDVVSDKVENRRS